VTVQVNKPIPGFVDGTAVGVAPIGVPLPGAGRTQTQSVTSKKGATAQLPVTQNKGRKRN
jgi:hypothetical protein